MRINPIVYFLFIVISFLSVNTISAQSNVIDEVVAVVGDKPVMLSSIEQQYQQAIMEGMSYPGDLKCYLFEQLLIQKLMINQAVLDSVEVNENSVTAELDQRMNYFINQIGSKEKLEEYFNKPLHLIKKDQRAMLHDQMMMQQMQREITKDVKVTPAEVRDYVKNLPADSVPLVAPRYEISQLMLTPKIEPKEIERVKEQLRGFQTQVREGRDFATIAVLYSEDTESAKMGGDLGWMSRAQLVPEFANVAFNLQEKGQVSKVVETEYGFHIIQLIERKGDRINVRHILIKPKISTQSRKNAIAKLDSIQDKINTNALFFEEAVAKYSMDKDTRFNGGVMVNPDNQTTQFEVAEMLPEMAKNVLKMKVNDISEPFFVKDERGKESYRIIQLKNKIEEHPANIGQDFQLLQELMIEKKKKETVDNWTKAKMKETYISINKNWQNCEFQYKGWIK